MVEMEETIQPFYLTLTSTKVGRKSKAIKKDNFLEDPYGPREKTWDYHHKAGGKPEATSI